MPNDNYTAAMKKANKAEAKRLAKLLVKQDRDLDQLAKSQQLELRKITIAYTRRERAFKRDFAKAYRATTRTKSQIYRRLQILNGRIA